MISSLPHLRSRSSLRRPLSSTSYLPLTMVGLYTTGFPSLRLQELTRNRQFANCGGAGFYLDQTCIPDTTLGAQLLSLHAGITSTKPTYRRITYDIGNDASGFSLDSVYVSTKPLSGGDFATIIMCGWSVEDQYVEGMPTWCEYVKLEGSTPFRRKVEVKRDNIAYIVVGAALNYAPPELDGAEGFGKGNVPVEFQLDDMAVCVPP